MYAECLRVTILLFIFGVEVYSAPKSKEKDYVLLVSFDGFRWDYLDLVKSRGRETPNFDYLIKAGVQADYVKNAFVTNTWPNHWTLATGMYIESHGVVANKFLDLKTGLRYDGPDTSEPMWYNNGSEGGGGEPIWVTYQKASFEHNSAIAIWPGGDAEVNGIRAKYKLPQNNSISFQERVDSVIGWMVREEEPAHLGLLYFDEPDSSGHSYGPESKEVEDKIVEMDGVMGYIIRKLVQYRILNKTNLIVTSDHGMASVKQQYKLDDYIDPNIYTISGESPNYMFLPHEGKEEEAIESLSKVPNSKLYRKGELPEEFHYTYNDRILPLLLVMDEKYTICCPNDTTTHNHPVKGEHGYDNNLQSMHPFFIAHGPAFKSGHQSQPFNSTDIYPLICHLLSIEPHANNGSYDNIRHILKHNGELYHYMGASNKSALIRLSTSAVSILIMLAVALVVTVSYFIVSKKSSPSGKPKALTVDMPGDTDRQRLVGYEALDSGSDMEEWQPLSHSGRGTQDCRDTAL